MAVSTLVVSNVIYVQNVPKIGNLIYLLKLFGHLTELNVKISGLIIFVGSSGSKPVHLNVI